MKAKGVSVVIVIATLSCAAVAVAQEPDPDADATPAGEEPPPEGGSLPGDAPAVDPTTAPPVPAAAPPDADTTLGSVRQIAISDDLQMVATRESVAGQSASETVIALRPAVDFFPIRQPVDRRPADHRVRIERRRGRQHQFERARPVGARRLRRLDLGHRLDLAASRRRVRSHRRGPDRLERQCSAPGLRADRRSTGAALLHRRRPDLLDHSPLAAGKLRRAEEEHPRSSGDPGWLLPRPVDPTARKLAVLPIVADTAPTGP